MADDRSIIAGEFGNELALAPPPAGHNQARTVDLARERVDAIAKTANEWLAKVPEIQDEETAQRAQTFLRQIDQELKALDAEEKAQKKPMREQIAAIGNAYSPVRLILETVKGIIAPKRKAWLDREQRRLDAEKARQREEAARLAREADEAARLARQRLTVENKLAAEQAQEAASKAAVAAAAPPQRAQVRDLYGGRAASVRSLWRAKIVDQLQVYIVYQNHPDLIAVLQRLADADAPAAHREGRKILGCELIEKPVAA